MLELYWSFMAVSGLFIALAMGSFVVMFNPPPIRGWWLSRSLYALTASLGLQGLRLTLVYGLRLLGFEIGNIDRWISAVLTLFSTASAVFFFVGYLRRREWGPGSDSGQNR